jgi:hypothetical protein
MRAINHALTGALIGLTIGEPLVAVPAALASHYVCDAIPHYGSGLPKQEDIRSLLFKRLLYADAVLCLTLVLLLGINKPPHWELAGVCAFAAVAPDLLSFNRYAKTNAHKKWRPGAYTTFAQAIQWFERPIGAVVEVVWFVAMLTLLAPFWR